MRGSCRFVPGSRTVVGRVASSRSLTRTCVISLLTAKNKTDEELKGLVYSLTPKPETAHEPWFKQPVTVGLLVLAVTIVLNIIFW